VDVVISADITGSLHVATDATGVLAQGEIVYNLLVDGNPVLFHDDLLSVGPSTTQDQAVSQTLTATITLQFDTPYSFLSEVDAESRAITAPVPEPGTWLLALAGLGLPASWKRRRGTRRQAAEGRG
jgi:MYXO-CTERM domain-containing protein